MRLRICPDGGLLLLILLGSLASGSPVLPVDCNGNGVDDAEDVASGLSEDCNANGVPDECEGVGVQFGLRDDSHTLWSTPRAVTAVDVDGDSLLDVVVAIQDASASRGRLSIYRRTEDGRLESPRLVNLTGGVSSLATLDADRDGTPDVALADDGLLTILTGDGDGRFDVGTTEEVDGNLYGLATADVNGDGLTDVVATDSENDRILVFSGDGDGGFSSREEWSVGSRPFGLAVADLDGDGSNDIVATDWQGHSLSVLLGDGGGGFASRVEIASGGRNPREVIASDLDLDGDLDLAVANLDNVTVLLNGGGASFTVHSTFQTVPRVIVPGDFDRDGYPDIAVGFARANVVTVLVNDGTGRLGSASDLGIGSTAQALCSRDLDDDGDLDILVATGDPDVVTTLWNGEERTSVTARSTRYLIAQPPHAADIADMDGDGDLDVITGNGLRGTVTTVLNNGDGTYRLRGHTRNLGYLNSVNASDMDGDGDLDVVTADHQSQRVFIAMNDGDAGLDEVRTFGVGRGNTFFVTTGDFDGDGAPDVIAANEGANQVSLLLNDGAGRLGTARAFRVGARPVCATVADVDEDGRLDVAVANELSASVSLLRGDGAGSFDAPLTLPVRGRPTWVISGDWDADGDVDLATANHLGRQVGILINAGGGEFLPATLHAVGQTPYSLRTADMDGDGVADLVTANRDAHTVSILAGDGAGAFSPSVHFSVGTEPRFVLLGDLDRNGTVDMVSANHDSDDITVLINQMPPPYLGDFLTGICTAADFERVTVRSTRSGAVERTGKFTLPARVGEDLLEPVFQNSSKYGLHEDFLATVFPDRFAGLDRDPEEYRRRFLRRATRDYWVGALARVRVGTELLYTFTLVSDSGSDFREAPTREEVESAWSGLRAVLRLEPLAYQPTTPADRRAAESWVDVPFPVWIDSGGTAVRYEAYTLAVGFGRVRRMDQATFLQANDAGRFTFQDILVLDASPRDIEGVVGGVVTAEPQGDLSHISIRTARRGTPNAYIADAFEEFEPWDDRLVRLEVLEGEYSVREATLEEAEEHWDSTRPRIGELEPYDADHTGLDSLAEMDLTGSTGSPEARFGGKASNLARLGRILTGTMEPYRESGFAIPVRYYLDFMASGRIPSLRDAGRRISFQEFVDEAIRDPEFVSDSEFRFLVLEYLRDYMRERGEVDSALIGSLAERVHVVFGSTSRMVRFRSSSNVEDLLDFNGAGLYDSTSVCVDDVLDTDGSGPSRCDPLQPKERTIERALRKVWASLWTFRAFEERAFYRIPQTDAAMGILVSRAFLDEVANGVAFTGNPSNPLDRRYMIAAQIGENSVVSPPPDEIPERSFVQVEGGEVVRIWRDRASSLVEPGEVVLSDAQVRELGEFLWHIEQEFPIDPEEHSREEILLDIEFKIEPTGELAVKQVRPFLMSIPLPPTPTFRLEVPPASVACGVFSRIRTGRTLREEYEAKSRIRFRAGAIELPTRETTFAGELFDSVRFGPDGELASPAGPGIFEVRRIPEEDGVTAYRFRFEQDFDLSGGRRLTVSLDDLTMRARGEEPIEDATTLERDMLDGWLVEGGEGLLIEGFLDDQPVVSYASCGYGQFPLHETTVGLGELGSITLEERFLPSENLRDTGPAALVRARVEVGGQRRVVTDYWRLVYTAFRHNTDVRYWVVLDDPLELDGLDRPVRAVEIVSAVVEGTLVVPPHVIWLDDEFAEIGRVHVESYGSEDTHEPAGPALRRGDVDGDGAINLADPIRILSHLFLAAREPGCVDAADANDDGGLNLTDAVHLLLYLFQGGAPPAPPSGSCGIDPTPDDLTCETPSCS